jgi:hypothetical protein
MLADSNVQDRPSFEQLLDGILAFALHSRTYGQVIANLGNALEIGMCVAATPVRRRAATHDLFAYVRCARAIVHASVRARTD